MNHSKGIWKVGSNHGVVVTDCGDGFQESTGHAAVDYYGGYLIAESIAKKEDAHLIAAAPDLLEALRDAFDAIDANGYSGLLYRIELAINKATKGQ